MPDLHRVLAAAALAVGAGMPAQAPVPPPEALAAARTRSIDLLLEQMLAQDGGDAGRTVARLQELAGRAADDAATRCVLLGEACRLADQRGTPALAWQTIDTLAAAFAIDGAARRLALLQRLAAPAGDAAAAALLPLADTRRGALEGNGADGAKALLRVAEQAAFAAGDRWLGAAVTRIGGEAAAFRALPARARVAPFVAVPETHLDLPFGELAAAAGLQCDDAERRRTLADVGAERLLALSAGIADPLTGRAVRRAARQLFAARALHTDDPVALSLLSRQLTGCATALADLDGLTRLRFRERDDLRQLVVTRGRWRVEDGLLLGATETTENFATVRYAFAATRSVVLRGGIRSPAGLNFRFAAGDANAILNWEVAPQNHFWCCGIQQTNAPPVLAAGREYTIALHAAGDEVLLFVDDALCFRAKGRLAGTVCLYPALGSEIFVREILVDGDLEGAGPVSGPRGEPK